MRKAGEDSPGKLSKVSGRALKGLKWRQGVKLFKNSYGWGLDIRSKALKKRVLLKRGVAKGKKKLKKNPAPEKRS